MVLVAGMMTYFLYYFWSKNNVICSAEWLAVNGKGNTTAIWEGWRTGALRTVNLRAQPGPLGWWANAVFFLHVLCLWSFPHPIPRCSGHPYFLPSLSPQSLLPLVFFHKPFSALLPYLSCLSNICFVLQLPGNEKGIQLLYSWYH